VGIFSSYQVSYYINIYKKRKPGNKLVIFSIDPVGSSPNLHCQPTKKAIYPAILLVWIKNQLMLTVSVILVIIEYSNNYILKNRVRKSYK